MLSDFYELSLDELVRGIDINDVRDKGITSQQLTYIESNIRQFKDLIKSIWYSMAVLGWVIIGIVAVAIILQLLTR